MRPSTRLHQADAAVVLGFCLFFMSANPASSTPTPGVADPIQDLKKERLVLLKEILDLAVAGFKQGASTLDQVHQARVAYSAARLDFAETKAEKTQVAQEAVKEAEDWVKQVEKLLAAGQASRIDVLKAQVGLKDARIALAKAEAGP